jgi:hypothetical protein
VKTVVRSAALCALVAAGLAAFGVYLAAVRAGVFLQQFTATAREAAETLHAVRDVSAQVQTLAGALTKRVDGRLADLTERLDDRTGEFGGSWPAGRRRPPLTGGGMKSQEVNFAAIKQ